MSTVNKWYIFHSALDEKICNKIKRLAKNKWVETTVDISKDITDKERRLGCNGDFKPDHKMRISDVSWCNDQWLYDLIWPFMEQANYEAGWRYDIKSAESMQITRYKKGGFYTFHSDGNGDHLSIFNNPQNSFMHGYVRKLSMSILLNDAYEGGEFQFALYKNEQLEIEPLKFNKKGSIMVFPSTLEHRVTPITKGIKYSLVVWFLGPPFR